MEDARAQRKIVLEKMRLERFGAFKNNVESLTLNPGDPITLELEKAGYDDRGPDFVGTEMVALYKGIDTERRGIRVELVEPNGERSGKETFFPFDEYEKISIRRTSPATDAEFKEKP